MTTPLITTQRLLQEWVTGWGTTTPFALDNEEFNPPSTEWARFTIRDLAGGQESLGRTGNRKFRRRFQVIVQCFTPFDIGQNRGLELATIARDIFEGRNFDDIHCLDGDIQRVGVPEGDSYYQVTVFVPGWYEQLK